jgi:hypothetical protein
MAITRIRMIAMIVEVFIAGLILSEISIFPHSPGLLSEYRKVIEKQNGSKSGIRAGLAVGFADFILNYIPPNT